MLRDYTVVLWLLKFGTLINLFFLINTRRPASADAEAHILLLAQIFFAVSAYRCLFPVRYEHNAVFHDSILSSIFMTRLFATFSEIAYIFFVFSRPSFAQYRSCGMGDRFFLADGYAGRD